MSDQTNTPSRALTIGEELGSKRSQFVAALPAHMPEARFMRVVLTAIQNNPKLATADRASLWNACMRAAQDGLLPDGRDGALVIYSTKVGDKWVDKVQWMPMVGGIRKKVRNSGEIATMDVTAVYEKDDFEFEKGDDPFIKHRPFLGVDPGPSVAFYSVVLLKTGEKSREVMSRAEVEYVRDTYSKKDRNGAFSPAWVKSFDEMAKKTVFRRHSKVLPMSSDLDDLLRRDDDLYEKPGADTARIAGPKKTLSEKLDAIAGDIVGERVDPETGEITESVEGSPASQPGEDAGGLQATASSPSNTGPGVAAPGSDAGGNGPALQEEPSKPATAAAGASKDPPVAAKSPTVAQKAAQQRLSALTAKGTEAANSGTLALNAWSDSLDPQQIAEIPPALWAQWTDIAKEADK